MLIEGDIHFVAQKVETKGLVVPSKIYGIMAVGRPTIFIGPRDSEVGTLVRESESGIMVPPGDIEGTANAIIELSLNNELRRSMGAHARQYYWQHLTQERGVAQIIQAIEKTQSDPSQWRSAPIK
jgi:glycosyltransferase involved in cell wall biosynthesis